MTTTKLTTKQSEALVSALLSERKGGQGIALTTPGVAKGLIARGLMWFLYSSGGGKVLFLTGPGRVTATALLEEKAKLTEENTTKENTTKEK